MGNRGYRILLIEDNKLDQMAFKRMVERKEFSYDCTIAGSVSKARDILGSESFDIVIADYILRDGTAFDVLDAVKDAPIILVTGAGDEETAVRAWKAGAYDYLIKDPLQNYLNAVPITIENAIKHKKMEEQLHLLSHAIMSTDDSIYITDMDDKIIFVNRAFCDTYGYEQQEVIGKGGDILWDASGPITDIKSFYQHINGLETGFYHKRKNGGKFSVSLSRSSIKNENGDNIAIVGVVRDISEHILVENELRDENVRLKRKRQLKSQAAAAVSEKLKGTLDDLKNTLANARAGAVGGVSATLQKSLESAQKNIDRINDILNGFLDGLKEDTDQINEQDESDERCRIQSFTDRR